MLQAIGELDLIHFENCQLVKIISTLLSVTASQFGLHIICLHLTALVYAF